MTRRRTTSAALLLAAGLLLATGLVACGGSGSDEGGSEPAADTKTGSGDAGTAADAGGTVTIEHRYGSTEIPTNPKRIVSLDTQWTDVLAALAAAPVGYIQDPNAPDGYPWRTTLLHGSTPIQATDQLPYEKIAALKPDLIVVSYLAQDEADYEKLSAIAPTIATLSDAEVDTWQDITTAAGKVLGRPDDAQALIDQVDRGVADVAESLPGLKGKTYSLVNYVPGDQFYVVSDPDDGAAVLFKQLGMTIAPDILKAAKGASGRVELSLEQAQRFDADLLLLLANGSDPEEIAGYDQLTAVEDGAVTQLDYPMAVALNTPTPLSIPFALKEIRPALEAAAAHDRTPGPAAHLGVDCARWTCGNGTR